MFDFLKKNICPIGVDIEDNAIRMTQLSEMKDGVVLIAGASKNRPDDIKYDSSGWQRWAIDSISELMDSGRFQGRDVVAALPASDVFIDTLKIEPQLVGVHNSKNAILNKLGRFRNPENGSNLGHKELRQAILPKIKNKITFDFENALLKCVTGENGEHMVFVSDREKIDRHLAIYEKAGLWTKSIGVWPEALTNSYTRFFGRRKTDLDAVVMLLDIEQNYTNAVICRHKNILFARSIPIGAAQLTDEKIVTRLTLELDSARRRVCSVCGILYLDRLIFLSGKALDVKICLKIAKQLEMPAQMGDCMVAVEVPNVCDLSVDRRECQLSWAVAFGLSLA